MRDAIRQFRDDYADRFAGGVSRFLRRHGRSVIAPLHDAAARPRSTVYLFGNGGSHAISKCMEYALRDYAGSRRLALRVVTGVDVHTATSLEEEGGHPGASFVNVLEAEGADARDLVVLVSGSGDSDNLCAAAAHAERRSIPTLAVIGTSRGRLRDLVPPGRCFCVPVEDQQIAEDIIQSLAYFLGRALPDAGHDGWDEAIAARAEQLRLAIRTVPEDFIAAAADAVLEAFRRGRFVWVLGFGHPALSVCAEHTAHNLYWDSVYQVNDPPRRLVWSSPTACDFSGISNDRRRRVITHLTGLNEEGGGGCALLYSTTLDGSLLRELLERVEGLGIRAFVVCSGAGGARRYAGVEVHQTGLEEPQAQAGASQALGHILGRAIRMGLLERRGQPGTDSAARFLIDHDLAQRRLLDGRG